MELPQLLTLLPNRQTPAQVQPEGLSLRLGQVLTATVLNKTDNGLIELMINNQVVKANHLPDLKPGQELTVRVTQERNPATLQISELQPALEQAKQSERTQLLQAKNLLLREAYPKQTSLLPLLKNVSKSVNNQQGAVQVYPKPIVERLKDLFQSIKLPTEIRTAKGLKQAIQDSGNFLESHLAAKLKNPTTINTGNDIKAQLIKLVTEIKNQTPTDVELTQTPAKPQSQTAAGKPPVIQTNISQPANPSAPTPSTNTQLQADKPVQQISVPTADPKAQGESVRQATNDPQRLAIEKLPNLPELSRQVEASLARIAINQHHAVVVDEGQPPVWLIDLPVNVENETDLFTLTIHEEHSHKKESETSAWTMHLDFDLEGLGNIHARITLMNEEITTVFWTERQQTLDLIKDHASELAGQLTSVGLTVADIQYLQGQHEPQVKLKQPDSLVDIRL